MKTYALPALAAVLLLAFAGTAQAKEIGSLKVCGKTGCNTLNDPEQLRAWMEDDGSTSQTLAPAQRYYTVDIGFTDGQGNTIHTSTASWLPDGALIRYEGDSSLQWWSVSAKQTALYKKIAGGIEAFTPELSKVTVKGRIASDPSSYLRLFGNFPYRAFPKAKLHLVSIKLTAATPNPWVSSTKILRYDPQRRLLIRPDGYYKLPAALGKLVMTRASLSSKASSGTGGGVDSALLAGLGVGGIAAIGVLGLAKLKKMT
jgi:hypothetical protein